MEEERSYCSNCGVVTRNTPSLEGITCIECAEVKVDESK